MMIVTWLPDSGVVAIPALGGPILQTGERRSPESGRRQRFWIRSCPIAAGLNGT
jgi:hypothetical protein